MANLIYAGLTSLDGYTEDADGNFDWSAPDEEVHAFINDLERSSGTYLYGRRMYEVMLYWETVLELPETSPVERDFAVVWQDTDKIVYSSTLNSVSSAHTRLERHFDPEMIRRLKMTADGDIGVAGPNLAAQAIKAGLVDEFRLFVCPVVVGGGTRFFPDDVSLRLELVDERRFSNGVVYLSYRCQA